MERKKSPDSTVQKAIQQHVVEHAERDKALKMLRSSTASKPNSCVLPLGAAGRGLESEVDVAHLFLTIIQFHSACHLISHTQTLAYTTISSHLHPHTYKVLWRWASGEAAGVGHTGSCSCRPAHRRLSSNGRFL